MSSLPHSDNNSQIQPEVVDSWRAPGWSPRVCFGLAAIVALLEVCSISYMMVSTALPAISRSFQTTQTAWMVTAFMLAGAVVSPIVAKLADLHGKRLMLLVSVAIAALGALVSAMAANYAMMVAGRTFFGFFVPCMFLSYLIIRDVFPARTVPLAISIVTSGLGLVAIPAPFLTGWLIDTFGFRSIFWFMLCAMVPFAALVRFLVPESPVRVHARVDTTGAALLGAGIAAVLVAVSFGPSWGWASGSTLAFLLGGIALLCGWFVFSRVLPEPLIDTYVLARRPVLLTTLIAGVVYGVSGLTGVLLPLLIMTPPSLQLGYGWGYDTTTYGIYKLPVVIAIVVGGLLVGWLVTRGLRPRLTVVVGLALSACGFGLLAVDHHSLLTIVIGAGLCGFGQGMGYASVPNLLIEFVEPRHQATTASVMSVNQGVFTAVITVVVFAVLNNSHIAVVAEGASFYDSSGFTTVYLVIAAVAVAGLLMALTLPRPVGAAHPDLSSKHADR
ncbi:MFS family permease [Gordonia terrae]